MIKMIIGLILSFIVFILIYFTLNNYVFAAIFTIYTFLYSLYVNIKFKKYFTFIQKTKECNNFINTFSISLSISNSIDKAYQDTSLQVSKQLKKELNKLVSIDNYENLKSLEAYFTFPNYQVFLNILHLYINNGGNFLKMTELLREELRRNVEIVSTLQVINTRKIYECSILWGFSTAIIVFCRFGLTNVFVMMAKSNLFIYGIIFFFIFELFSIHLLLKNCFSSLEIINYEKTKK